MAHPRTVVRTVVALLIVATLVVSDADASPSKRREPRRRPLVALCHVPPGNPEQFRTIQVGRRASRAHVRHGDREGACTPELCAELQLCDDGDICTVDVCRSDGCEHRATACPPPPGGSVWAPATTPYDASCSDCETIVNIEMPHLGGVDFRWNPAVDDPVAQWSDCTFPLLDCITGGQDPIACSRDSTCPDECRTALEGRLAGLTERRDIANAFAAVYSDESALCRPAPEEINP